MGQNFLCEENMRGPSFISNLGNIFMVWFIALLPLWFTKNVIKFK